MQGSFTPPHIILVIFGLITNFGVLYVIARKQRLHTTTNFFIVNLVCANLVVMLLCVPLAIAKEAAPSLELNKWIVYTQMVSSFASVYFILAVAMDGYRAVSLPLNPETAKLYAVIATILVWIAAILTPLPWLIGPNNNIWSDKLLYGSYFILVQFFSCYLLPLLLVLVLCHKIWNYSTPPCNVSGMSSEPSRNIQELRDSTKKNSIETLLGFTLAAFVCFLPLNVVYTCTIIFDWGELASKQSNLTISLPQYFAFIHSFVNPLVYAFQNKKFQESICSIYKNCCNDPSPQNPQSVSGSLNSMPSELAGFQASIGGIQLHVDNLHQPGNSHRETAV